MEGLKSRLCAVVAEEHPLAKFEEVKLSQLKAFLTSVPAKGMNARTMIDGLLRDHSVDLKPLMEINEIQDALYGFIVLVHCYAIFE